MIAQSHISSTLNQMEQRRSRRRGELLSLSSEDSSAGVSMLWGGGWKALRGICDFWRVWSGAAWQGSRSTSLHSLNYSLGLHRYSNSLTRWTFHLPAPSSPSCSEVQNKPSNKPSSGVKAVFPTHAGSDSLKHYW